MFQAQAAQIAHYAPYGLRDDLSAVVADYSSFQQPQLELHGPGSAGGSGGGSGGQPAAATATTVGGVQQVSLPNSGAAAALGIFHQRQQHQQHHHQHRQQVAFNVLSLPTSAISSYSSNSPQSAHQMEPSTADDLAAQEAAAREYQPQLEGPLVGERITSHAITEEYAKADPIYVTKTLSLPETYSHYRPIQGDGNCGWRAIGFAYFETLINLGDVAKIDAERQRVTELDKYILNVGGYAPFLFEDMVEETKILFEDIINCMPHTDAALAVLAQKFNDADTANAIIYHLRLLAASWLKGNADAYQDFIQGSGGIQGFCQEWIERPDREIDHMGITLLVNILLKPINFVLEIAYLDRSEGSQVNVYRFPDDANTQDVSSLGPMIYLLFRPDHYDILYRPAPAPTQIQVNRVTNFSHNFDITSNTNSLEDFTRVDMTTLAMLPGFGAPGPGLSPIDTIAPSPTSPMGEAYNTPSPQSPWMAQPPYTETYPQPQHTRIPIRETPEPPPAPANTVTEHPLRFSRWQYPELIKNAPLPEPTFQTTTFRNSHFNTAHYNNPNFQPEEYKPDLDEFMEPIRNNGRKRATRLALLGSE